MLIAQPKARILTKIIRNEDGRFVLGYFLLAQFEGQIFVKLVKIEELQTVANEETIALPAPCCKSFNFNTKDNGYSVESPYKIFDFCTSQKTRAPTSAL